MSGTRPLESRLDSGVRADLESWTDDPELGPLAATLTRHTKVKSFLDTLAEVMVARHLRGQGCRLRFEVPTPNGRACDFEVDAGDGPFYLHVKRVDTDRPVRKRLSISSRLRVLERIERPFVVSVRWQEGANDKQMQRLVKSASEFVRHARVGEELVVHDEDGREIGGVLIMAPWDGPHVTLAIGLPSGFIDEAPRIRKLMRRAYRQFMPRSENVILICTSQRRDLEVFDDALFGSHVERWDAFPPRGRRVAHGRAGDGLWHRRRYAESRIAGWFPLRLETPRLDAVIRRREDPAPSPALAARIGALFAGD